MKQISKFTKIIGLLLVMGLLFATLPNGQAQAATPPEVVYDAIPATLAPSYPSQAFQAQQTAEFGDYVILAGTTRTLRTVTVTMVTWAYQSNNPGFGDTTGWDHPITLNIYNVVTGASNTLGSLVGTKTQTVHIPWRPEPDTTNCPSTDKWYNAGDASCNNGFAFNITFDLSASNITLPDAVVLGIAFNTQTYGASPMGATGPYNSLNVSVIGNATVGTDGDTDRVFWNTKTASYYSDGGSAGVGIFREDTNWTGYGTIPFQITTAPAPCTTECYVDAASGDDTATGMIDSPFKTIQKGIDTVTAGGTVHVAAGTYNEDLEVGKSITILGPNALISPNTGTRAPEAIVAPLDEVGVADTAVNITSGNIDLTIKGLTFDMVNTADGTDRFVESVSKTGIALVFENNQFLNAPSADTGNWNLTGVGAPFSLTLEDNYFHGSGTSNGITMWDSERTVVIKDNVWKDNQGWVFNFNRVTGTISNNQILDVEENGANWYDEQAGFLFAEENHVSLMGNTFDGLPNPSVRIYDSFTGELTGTGNVFKNTEDPAIGAIRISAGANLSAVKFEGNSFTNNPIATQNLGTEVLNASGNYWGTIVPAEVKLLAGNNVDFTPWLDSGVDTDLATAGFQGDFSTLHVDDDSPQTGLVNRVQEGINMVSGSTVLVEPGIYKGAVLIDKPLTLKSTQGPAVTTIHGGDTASDTIYVVSIRASDVTLDGFTVTSPNYNAPGADLTGIMIGYYGDNDLANIVVKNNIVTQIGLSTRLVTQDDYPSVGMVVNGVIDGLQITNNKVFDIHQSVTDPAVTWGPTGIAYYGYDATPLSKNVVISGNEVYNISANAGAPATTIANGIRVGWGSGDGSITGNNIHDIDGRGIAVTSINNGTVAITENVVTKTKTGVYMANALGGTILKNNLFNNGTGIQIDGAAPVSVHINRIFGNTITGLANTSSAAVAAENNWWGCNAGPNDAAAKCDKTTGPGTITSSPWLILQTLANPTSVDPSGTAAITANLRANSALADTSAAGYLVNGLPVAFTAPAGGVLAPAAGVTLDAQATTTYTATAVRGNYEVCSTVDNQTTCMPLVVNNRAPMAVDDAYDTDQDTTLTITAPGVLANDSDPDGDTRTATLLTSVTHGTLTLKGDGSFIYTPAAGYFGTDTFTYQLVTYPALAATGWTDEALVTITVHEVPVPVIYYYFPIIIK